MTDIYNIRHERFPRDAVNIMRPGPWGNPFEEKVHGRDGCIALFEHWLFLNPAFVERIRRELRHKDLVCCCWPQRCHGDVIAKVLAGQEPSPLPADSPVLMAYLAKQKDGLADLLAEMEGLLSNPAPADDGGSSASDYEALCMQLRPHLMRLTKNRRELWPRPPLETVEVNKADLLAWRAEWMENNPVEDGTDHITPFDHYLYGSKP